MMSEEYKQAINQAYKDLEPQFRRWLSPYSGWWGRYKTPTAEIIEQLKMGEDRTVTNFEYYDFSGMDLKNLDLVGVDLSEANFSNADLTGSNLTGSILTVTKFDGANLIDTIFTDAHIEYTGFKNTIKERDYDKEV